MTDQQWSPPPWARLIAYLAGVGFFVIQPLVFPPPNFPLLAMDCLVLIGLSPEVFKQFAYMFLAAFGKSPPSPRNEEDKEA